MKLKATKEQKQRARMIAEGVDKAQQCIRLNDLDEAENWTFLVQEMVRELMYDIEMTNLERWWRV